MRGVEINHFSVIMEGFEDRLAGYIWGKRCNRGEYRFGHFDVLDSKYQPSQVNSNFFDIEQNLKKGKGSKQKQTKKKISSSFWLLTKHNNLLIYLYHQRYIVQN